jgi:sugar phosphate isomerase/epimerase
MAVQLIVLRGVPEDEAEEIRALLADAGIDYYETPEGNWGVSLPAVWLKDQSQLERARELLSKYEAERAAKARSEYQRAGGWRGILQRLKEDPFRVLLYLALIVAVLYFSTMPFLSLGE